MPSSYSFFRKNQNNSSSSSLENDSKSDQSEENDDNRIKLGCYKTRTIQNDNNMLERPSDSDDSCSQSDDTDNNIDEDDDDYEKENDLFTSSNSIRSAYLTRQVTLYEEDWPRRNSMDENKFRKPIYRAEKSSSETEQDKRLFLDSNQHRLFPSERSKLVGSFNTKHQSRNTHTSLSSDFKESTQQLHSLSELDNMPTTSASSQTKTDSLASPKRTSKNIENRHQPISKIPIRTNSSSQSRSRSPATAKTINNSQIQSTTIPSKIPVPMSTTNKGAFRFFTANDRPSSSSTSSLQIPPKSEPKQLPNQMNKNASAFTPITQSKTIPSSKKVSSTAGHTPSVQNRPMKIPSSDEDDSETNNLKEADLKVKLKEQKRYGKKTGELLNKLHENYEELLEKYAQAENTIDQLRFQPKILGDNTPPINSSEGTVHFIQQPKVQMTEVRSNGIYHSINGAPFSSIRQVPSITSATTTRTTTTTTRTRSAEKSTSPANSGTGESVFFDESVPQKIIVQELTTPETVKLDLLIQTKTLADKMKSFLTLIDANQLSLAEQKQVYENIKEDYEKLLKAYDVSKNGNDLNDLDFDADLNNELETMKQLLKEIVKRITDNLLGKSSNSSDNDHLTHEGSQMSQSSQRSSICNHGDLINQYQKIMNAANDEVVEKRPDIKSLNTPIDTRSEQLKKVMSRESSRSDVSEHVPSTEKNIKPYVYISGNSDDEQQQISDSTPVGFSKGIESAAFSIDRIPFPSNKQYQQVDEEQTHIHGIPRTAIPKKKKVLGKQAVQDYDNLDNITQSKRKIKSQLKKSTNEYQLEKELTPSSISNSRIGTRCSASSMRTRTSDYDSGIGTNNTTKLSRDSKLNTSNMDESHYQSLDEERRRYSDEEQGNESISHLSSSRSSGSGAASPGSPFSKYKKRFDRSLSSSSKQLNDNRRRKPSGHSDAYPSDIETHITGSFDTTPKLNSSKKPSYYNLPLEKSSTQRSHSKGYHRSLSTDSIDLENYKVRSYRPQTAPQISSKQESDYNMSRKYQSGFIHQHTRPSKRSDTMYSSSFYINQPHTHRKSQENLNQNVRPHYKQIQSTNNLYLDPQTGVVYRYIQNKNQPSTVTYYRPTSQAKSSQELYKCNECGAITSYHHRHHIESSVRRITTDIDDPGYESGNRKLKRYRKPIDILISSDSDSDDKPISSDLHALNEAYERAKRVQERSQHLSKHISRQLKLVLSTI